MPNDIPKETVKLADFQDWLKEHPDIDAKIYKENSRWGRIVCEWNEEKADGKKLTHHYAAMVDLQNGDLYMDCAKRKLFMKNLSMVVFRPIHSAIKTIYHAGMPFVLIYRGLSGKEGHTFKYVTKEIARNLADFILFHHPQGCQPGWIIPTMVKQANF